MKQKLQSFFCAVLCAVLVLTAAVPVWAAESVPLFGTDVSQHNGTQVPFDDWKAQGKTFTMIRMSYGNNHLDPRFWENVQAAEDAGVPFGVYHYSYAFNTTEAQIEANYVKSVLKQMKGKFNYFVLPVAYDLEDDLILKNSNTKTLTQHAITFCDAIRAAGYTPMVYANLNWFTNYLNVQTLHSKGYKLWYANWQPKTTDFSAPKQIGKTGVFADIWQYAEGDMDAGVPDYNVLWNLSALCAHNNSKLRKICTPATVKADGKCVTDYQCRICGKATAKTVVYSKISTVKLSKTAYTYNGKVQRPGVVVKDRKGNTLKNKTDYKITYPKGMKAVGKYTVKVTFMGNYSGSKSLTYSINPKGTSVSKVTAAKKGFKVTWKKQKTQTTGYQVQYSTDKNFKKNNKTVTISKNSTTSKSVGKLKAKKKYYVRVRTYKTVKFGGKNIKLYSGWSKAKSVTTKK